MKRNYLILLVFLTLLIVSFASVQYFPFAEENSRLSNLDSVPTRRELRRSFFEKREILVIYAAKDTLLAQKYKRLLHELSLEEQTNSWRSTKILYKNAAAVTEQELKENTVFLVGSLQEHPTLKRFLGNTPFKVNKKRIVIGDRPYAGSNGLLSVSFYPNPLMPNRPFSFLTGHDAVSVYDFFAEKVRQNGQSFYRQNLDYELYRNGERVVLGDFDTLWNIGSSTFFDFSNDEELLVETALYRFVNHGRAVKPKEFEGLLNEIKKTDLELRNWVGVESTVPQISYHFYATTESKGLMTGNTDHAHIDTLTNTVHLIKNAIYNKNNIGKGNALVLHHLLGLSKSQIFELGLPIYFTDTWQFKGYGYWAARLVESGNTLSLRELFDDEYLEFESPLVRDCLAATLVDFLIKKKGKQEFLELYRNLEQQQLHEAALEAEWQEFLKNLPLNYPKKQHESKRLPYLKGFNFAHEGYSIYNGYGSTKATESLIKQKQLGSNAMAIVPYSYIPDINTPSPFQFSSSAGNENAEAVVHATHTARELGMFTLLKPQIFVGGSWPGGIEMQSEEDWELFFEHYYRWIRHYAFLAEIYGMDALCLGVEFTKATLTHPEAWRKMIQRTRGLFSGQLTYSANWGEEFENIEFWDDLDFIGLNSYYPLSKKEDPTDEELTKAFEAIKVKIDAVHRRFNKPVVFTEIGFRSIDTPWKSPHAEADESINEISQQRCYEVIFKGIENEPWCQGILWWKFPSYLEYRGTENNAFTPNNKRAEETVRHWFSK